MPTLNASFTAEQNFWHGIRSVGQHSRKKRIGIATETEFVAASLNQRNNTAVFSVSHKIRGVLQKNSSLTLLSTTYVSGYTNVFNTACILAAFFGRRISWVSGEDSGHQFYFQRISVATVSLDPLTPFTAAFSLTRSFHPRPRRSRNMYGGRKSPYSRRERTATICFHSPVITNGS